MRSLTGSRRSRIGALEGRDRDGSFRSGGSRGRSLLTRGPEKDGQRLMMEEEAGIQKYGVSPFCDLITPSLCIPALTVVLMSSFY